MTLCEAPTTQLLAEWDVSGELVSEWPASLVLDDAFGVIRPATLAFGPAGELAIAMEIRTNREPRNPGNQARVRVLLFEPDQTLRWRRDLTSFPDGPDEFPRTISFQPNGNVLVVGRSSGPEGSVGFVIPMSATGGAPIYRYTHVDPTIFTGGLLLEDASAIVWGIDGSISRGGQEHGLVMGFDDTMLVTHESVLDQAASGTFSASYSKVVAVSQADPTGFRIHGVSLTEDELVPTPPRVNFEVWTRLMSARGVVVDRQVIRSRELNGVNYEEALDEQLPRYASSAVSDDLFEVGDNYAEGIDDSGLSRWRIRSVDETGTTRAWSRNTTFVEAAYLFCASEFATLSCWLTR